MEYIYNLWGLKAWVLVPGLSHPSCDYPSPLTSLNVTLLFYTIGIVTISSEVSDEIMDVGSLCKLHSVW